MNLKIISDSCLTMFDEEINEKNIEVVRLSVITDGVALDDSRTQEQVMTMLKNYANGASINSSQPSPQRFLDAYNKTDEEYIIVLTLSQKLSGTFQSANIAKDMYEGHSKIHIIDSYAGATAMDLIIEEALKNQEKMNFSELCLHLEDIVQEIKTYLSVDDLKALVKSGRISKTQAAIGNFLKVKPCLEVVDGSFVLKEKVRTSKKMIEYYVKKILETTKDNEAKVYFSSINSTDTVNKIIAKVLESKQNITFKIQQDIGTVLAVNLGKGSMAISIHVSK